MALEEQMSMDLGDVPDNTVGIDPVSGNEIPLGSTAEEVRDDIPANLSENEMVIPADVVKYWGVKLFEDLRAEAKMGYAQMQEDGRIGGEPMEEDIDIEISMEDVEMMDSPDAAEPEDAFLGKFFAGIREANKKQVEEKFSGMINALSYGAPPHGGIAPGVDRIVMLLANEKNIRAVSYTHLRAHET